MTPRPLFILTVYSHYFKITQIEARVSYLINKFKYRFQQMTWRPNRGKVERVEGKLFAVSIKNGQEYRFHINVLSAFKEYMALSGYKSELYRTVVVEMYEPAKVHLELKDGIAPRPQQVSFVEYIVKKDYNRSKFIGLQPGSGKTVITAIALAKMGVRSAMVLLPRYIPKWVIDIQTLFKVRPEDILVIEGSAQLKGLIMLARSKKEIPPFTLISNRTLANFIKNFDDDPGSVLLEGYDCTPDDLFKVMKVGAVVIDEVHLEFWSTYNMLLHTHVPLFAGLSGTLINNDRFMTTQYETVFPKDSRAELPDNNRYIKTYPVSYSINAINKIRTTEWGSTFYSHHAFEQSIMKNHHLLQSYKKMIAHVVDIGYIKEYQKGDKVAIYASSIAMCTLLTEYFKKLYPHLDVRRFVQDDPHENIVEPDIIVTTILSGGTAHDIPNLRTVILTINIMSAQSNVQTSGRLRELKDRDVKFFFLWCMEVDKHKEYYEGRKEMLKDRVRFIKDYQYGLMDR